MRESDFASFAAMLDDIGALLQPGHPLSGTAKALFFRSLSQFTVEQVRAALDAHVKDPQRGRFFPRPADVIAQIEGLASNDGRPGAEEAWAQALRARDEAETVVWTAEMSEAWAIAREVFELGDEVGARMAFREAYTRLVDEARRAHMPAAWSVSLGFDTERRAQAITSAVNAGRLPQSELKTLPAPARGELLLLPASTTAGEEARQRMRELADRLRAGPSTVSRDQLEHERTQQLKAQAAQLAAQHTEGVQP
jgi:hypothetical protein